MKSPSHDDDKEYERRAREYYDDKTKHREEVLPYLGFLAFFAVLIAIGSAVFAWLRQLV